MQKTTALHEVIYISTLAKAAPISVVGEVAGKSRSRNRDRDITGLLVFDGMRFCQQLEGDEAAVRALLATIEKDPRHGGLQVIHEGPLAGRRFQQFSLGYSPVDDEDVLARMETLRGPPALAEFLRLLQHVEL